MFRTYAHLIVVSTAIVLSHFAGTVTGSPVAFDDFESGGISGGTGWDADWAIAGSGGFVSSAGKIDGFDAFGLFGNSNVSRQVSPVINTPGQKVTLSFSFRADWNIASSFAGSEIGVNVLDGSSSPLLTLKFVDGLSELRLNDGGGDFSSSGFTFGQNAIYDFTFESTIGSDQYSFTAERRGSSESASGTDFTYSGRTTSSFGGLQFFTNAPSGIGNDGFLDSVSVVAVPEPTAFLFGGVVCSFLSMRYSRRRNRSKN